MASGHRPHRSHPPPPHHHHQTTIIPYQEYWWHNWSHTHQQFHHLRCEHWCQIFGIGPWYRWHPRMPVWADYFSTVCACVLVLLSSWWLQYRSRNCWHLLSLYYWLVYQERSMKIMSESQLRTLLKESLSLFICTAIPTFLNNPYHTLASSPGPLQRRKGLIHTVCTCLLP